MSYLRRASHGIPLYFPDIFLSSFVTFPNEHAGLVSSHDPTHAADRVGDELEVRR